MSGKTEKKLISLYILVLLVKTAYQGGSRFILTHFLRWTISRKTKSGLNIAQRGRRERHTRKEGDHLENLGLNRNVILKQTWEETVCGGSWRCELG